MPDPIFEAPNGRQAQVGAAGKHVIGMGEHTAALLAGGAKIINVSQSLFDAIPDVKDMGEAMIRSVVQQELAGLIVPPAVVDLVAIAKAVNDELARRQKE